MARIAQPATLKLLHGRSEGRDSGGRVVPPPPNFRRIAPNPPTWLTAEAKAEWRRVVPGLTRLELLKEEDRAALAAYCTTWAEFYEATKMLKEHGRLTIEAAQGTIPHPAVAIRRNAGRELRAWAAQFGLTPSAESNLALKNPADPDMDSDPFQ